MPSIDARLKRLEQHVSALDHFGGLPPTVLEDVLGTLHRNDAYIDLCYAAARLEQQGKHADAERLDAKASACLREWVGDRFGADAAERFCGGNAGSGR